MEIAQPTNSQEAIQAGLTSGLAGVPPNLRSDKAAQRIQGSFSGTLSAGINPAQRLGNRENGTEDESSETTSTETDKTAQIYQAFLRATEMAAKAAELAYQANLYNEMYERKAAAQNSGNNRGGNFTPVSKPKAATNEARNMVSGMSEEGSSDTSEAGEAAAPASDPEAQQGPAGDRSFSSPASESGPGNLLPNDRMDTQAPTPDESQDPSTPDADTPVEGQPTEGEPNETADPSGADQTLNPDGTAENDTETQPDEAPNEQGSTAPASVQPPVNAEASGAVSGTNPEDEQERSNELNRQRNAARQGQGDGNKEKGEPQEAEGEAKSDDYKLKHEYIIIALTIIKELADFLDIIPFVGWALSYLVDFFASSGLFYLYATQSKAYIKNVLVANIGLIVLTAILELFPYIGALPLVATLKLYLDKRSKDMANQFAKTQKKAEKTRANIFKRKNKKQA